MSQPSICGPLSFLRSGNVIWLTVRPSGLGNFNGASKMRTRGSWKPHEILYIQAAITLPQHEMLAAFHDIADLTGFSRNAVAAKARRIQKDAADELAWATGATYRPLPVAQSHIPKKFSWAVRDRAKRSKVICVKRAFTPNRIPSTIRKY